MAKEPSTYETILLLENEEDDVVLLKAMFKKAHLLNPIEVVSSVEDAVCYLKGDGTYSDREKYPLPVLMLVDLHVSGGSGFQILDWIRANPRSVPVGIVILTGSDLHAAKEAYKRGAHSFLVKPLKLEDFENMVRGVRGLHLEESKNGRYLRREQRG